MFNDAMNPNDELHPDVAMQMLIGELGKMVTVLVKETFLQSDDEHPLDALRGGLQDFNPDDPRLAMVNWDAAHDAAPVPETDEDGNNLVSTRALVRTTSFYARLLTRTIPTGEDGEGIMEGDNALLGFLKVLTESLTLTGLLTGNPGVVHFVKDFTDYGVNQAILAGTMIPATEEMGGKGPGDYAMSFDPASRGEVVGPWGLSREAFVDGGFPHAEDIYDSIVGMVRLADSCITEG